METQVFELKVLESSDDLIGEFCGYFKMHGYAIIRVSESVRQLEDFFEFVESFYDANATSQTCAYDPTIEAGYKNDQRLKKEFVAVRPTREGMGPGYGVALETNAMDIFNFMDVLARRCLDVLAKGLKVDVNLLQSMCDHQPLPEGVRSSSFLHLFKYYAAPTLSLSCVEHTDSGLVTVIPCTPAKCGLQCLDWHKGGWVDVEKSTKIGDVVVLGGETLSRLTAMYFPGTVHRVKCDSYPRYSIPFQLRARPNAVIDTEGLGCPLLQQIPQNCKQKITVAQFIS